jgi:hypothetical protein
MQEYEARYIRGCILCCTRSNRKQGLYHPLPVPTQPWESISMYFLGGLPTTRKRHDYLFVVVVKFNNMCILIPCKKTIKGQETTNMFFGQVWVHFGIARSIISYMGTIFLSTFWTILWEKMDTKLKRYKTFHPQKDGKIKVVNRILVQPLRGYNHKHPKT